jgi:hypothetical protein
MENWWNACISRFWCQAIKTRTIGTNVCSHYHWLMCIIAHTNSSVLYNTIYTLALVTVPSQLHIAHFYVQNLVMSKKLTFWAVLVCKYWCFGGTWCFLLQGRLIWMKMETVGSSITLVHTYQSTLCHTPEDSNPLSMRTAMFGSQQCL